MEDADRLFMMRLRDGQAFGPANMKLLEQWARQRRVPLDASLVPQDGGEAVKVGDLPQLAQIVQESVRAESPPVTSPPTAPGAIGPPPANYSGVIPYKNAPALIGYYLAVFSLIPCLGMLLGAAAVVLGIIGLRRRAANPEIKGLAHAMIAVIGGGIMALVWGALVVVTLVAASQA